MLLGGDEFVNVMRYSRMNDMFEYFGKAAENADCSVVGDIRSIAFFRKRYDVGKFQKPRKGIGTDSEIKNEQQHMFKELRACFENVSRNLIRSRRFGRMKAGYSFT